MAGIITTEYFLSSVFQIWLTDKLNRRTLLFISSWGEIITMAVLAITVHNGGRPAAWVAVAMVFLYNTFYSWGWLTVRIPLYYSAS
jgi:hypothetical protein